MTGRFESLGIRPSHLWLNELLATYVAHAFLERRHPELATLWRGILRGYVDAVTPEQIAEYRAMHRKQRTARKPE